MYLTLGDEVRVRWDTYWNNEFGSAAKPDESCGRIRALPYADLHLGRHARVFAQLIAAWAARSDRTKSAASDETGVDLVRGFATCACPRHRPAS